MYIAREHYLDILKQLEDLTKDNELLHHENTILACELQEEKTRNYELMLKFDHMEQQMVALNQQLTHQNESNHCDLKGQISKLGSEQKKLIETKFSELQCSSFQKYKVLEIKNRVNRIENHDLTSFTEKIKKVYLSCNDSKEEPSLKDLTKWIKGLAKGKQGKEMETSSTWKQNRKVKN